MLPHQFLSGIFDSAVHGHMIAIPGHADTFLIQYMDLVFIDLIRLGYYIVAATDELSAIQSSKILQRNIYFKGERQQLCKCNPLTTYDSGKSKAPSFPDCFELQTFAFTKDVGHQLIEVTVKRLQQSFAGTPSKLGKAMIYLPISTLWPLLIGSEACTHARTQTCAHTHTHPTT